MLPSSMAFVVISTASGQLHGQGRGSSIKKPLPFQSFRGKLHPGSHVSYQRLLIDTPWSSSSLPSAPARLLNENDRAIFLFTEGKVYFYHDNGSQCIHSTVGWNRGCWDERLYSQRYRWDWPHVQALLIINSIYGDEKALGCLHNVAGRGLAGLRVLELSTYVSTRLSSTDQQNPPQYLSARTGDLEETYMIWQ